MSAGDFVDIALNDAAIVYVSLNGFYGVPKNEAVSWVQQGYHSYADNTDASATPIMTTTYQSTMVLLLP